jgi:hypothetical protein
MQQRLIPRLVDKPGNLVDHIVDRLKVDLLKAASEVNRCVTERDLQTNRINIGAAIACADLLRELGHDVDVEWWENGDFLQIRRVRVDGRVTNMHSHGEGMQR